MTTIEILSGTVGYTKPSGMKGYAVKGDTIEVTASRARRLAAQGFAKILTEIPDEDIEIPSIEEEVPVCVNAVTTEDVMGDEDAELVDLESMTVDQLKEMARDLGLKTKGLKKAELVEAIYSAMPDSELEDPI